MSGKKDDAIKKKSPIKKILIGICILAASAFAAVRIMDWQNVAHVRQSVRDGDVAYQTKDYLKAEKAYTAARLEGEKDSLAPEEMIEIIDKIGNALREQSRYAEAETVYKEGITLADDNSIQEGSEILRLNIDLGESLYRAGIDKLTAANNCFLAANAMLPGADSSDDDDRVETASRQFDRNATDTYFSLAKIELLQFHYAEAEKWLYKVTAILPGIQIQVDPSSSAVQNVTALLSELTKQPQLKDSGSLAAVLALAGQRLSDSGMHMESIKANRQALEIADRDKGNVQKYVNTGAVAQRIALAYKALEQYEPARQYFNRAVKDLKEEPPNQSNLLLIAQAHIYLGELKGRAGETEAGMRDYAIAAEAFGQIPVHKPGAVRIFMSTGNWFAERDKFEDALKCYEGALKVLDSIADKGKSEETSVLHARKSIADSQWRQGPEKAKMAIINLQRLLPEMERSLGTLSTHYIVTLHSLGNAYTISGDHKKAIETYKKAIALTEEARREKKQMPDSIMPDAIGSMAQAYINLGQIDIALPIMERAVQGYEGTKNNPAGQINTHLAMANLYSLKGRDKDAERVYKTALALLSLRKDFYVKVQKRGVLSGYAALLRKMKRTSEAEKMEAEAKKFS